MGKKSRLKRERRQTQKGGLQPLELRTLGNPFSGVDPDELRRRFIDAGHNQAKDFEASTARIEELVGSVDPLCLLSAMAAYGLPVFLHADGTIVKPRCEILPAHIELAQAVCLRSPIDRQSAAPALGSIVEPVCETLAAWSGQFHAKRFVQLQNATTDAERERLRVQEHIRIATQTVRNWAYYDQVKRVISDLVTPIDARFEVVHGFRASDLVLIFDHLFHAWQRRINEHWQRLRGMMGARTLREAVSAYHTAFPDLSNSVDDFVREMRERHANLDTAKSMMMSHADLRLPELCTFGVRGVAEAISRPENAVLSALDAVSQEFGDLQDANPEHLFLSNPVWTKPSIKLTEGTYFCPMPQTFFAFCFEVLRQLVTGDEALRTAYDNRRSDYLEQQTEALFARAFPKATLVPNFKWHTPDRTQQFESDLIVNVDSYLLLVEAKSGRVSPESRRGAPQRLGQDIDSLLIEPSRQSQRLYEAVIAAQNNAAETGVFKAAFPVDLTQIHRVIRLSVTLEDIGFLQTNVNALKGAGYVPHDLHIAPAVTLSDLEVVFDILQSTPERIHYWVRRGDWEGRADYLADEIDLLGVYLKTGLNLGDTEFGSAPLVLVGASEPIDIYYEGQRAGVAVERPRYSAIAWWKDILTRIEHKHPPRWLEAAVVLLCAGHEQQLEIERRAKAIVADVRKNREVALSRDGLIYFPGKGRSEAIAILVLIESQMVNRYEYMERLAAQAFAEQKLVRECAVITLDVDGEIYPYSSLGWFTRPDDI